MEAEEDALVGMEATLSGPVGLRMTQCFGGVNAVRADPRRELVWVGTSAGDVTTLHAETLQPYSCWNPERANAPEKKQSLPLHLQTTQAILDLAPVGQESLVASCTKDQLTLNDVGGFTRFARKIEDLKRNKHQALQSSAKPATCTCLEATYATSSTVSLGHSEGAVSLVDFTREGEMVACCWPEKSFVPTGAALSGVHSVAPYRRGVICALNSPKGGSMVVTDFRDRRLCASQPSLSCFSGAIGCVKTQSLNSDLVVCCGYSKSRYGSEGGLVRDPYIKVFDVRYAVRAVTQVLCGFAPVAVTCHPQFSDCFLSFSEAGIVSVTDVSAGHGQVMQQFQLQASPYAQEGVHFAAGDISTSGDVFVFGDTVGNVQLWGTDATSALNPISEPLPVPSDTSYETCSTYQMDENGPLACVPTYAREDEGEPLLSDISKQDMCVGFPPRDLYPQVAREMATVDAKLSVVRITTKNEGILKNLNYRIPNPISRGVRRRDRKANDVFVPGKYLYKQIQGGGFHEGKYVEFDFGFYNTTKFAGLENNLPNCYCNPLLQVLYFTYPFCSELLRCTPDPNAEFCIRDELSFLVYMLRRAEGDQPCQAQNLMRALMQSQDALNVGVLSSTMDAQICRSTREIEADVNKEQSLFRRIQTLFRFLCEHLHKEELELRKLKSNSDHRTLAKGVFGFTNSVINKCTKGHVTKKDTLYFQTSLQLPKDTEVNKTFMELLQESIMSETSIRAWCNSCNTYVPMTQRRIVSSLPAVLAINCNIKNLRQLRFFASQATEAPWLKTKIFLKTDKAKGNVLASEAPGEDGDDQSKWVEYDLTAMISMVVDERGKNDFVDPDTSTDSITDTDAHFITHVRVHPAYDGSDVSAEGEEGEPRWVLFNDFCVTPTDVKDAMQMFGHKKVPCMLFYSRRGAQQGAAAKGLRPTPDLSRDGFHSLCAERPLTYGRQLKNTFTSLNPKTETPGSGGGMKVVGIDCEFVALSKTEKQLHPDGSETILKNARLVLARVSVVRGEGPSKNVCFIDDYVRAVEPVYDYLTRYSGLVEGDLDVGRSKHHLTTLKKTYMKLRYLVDQGCHFVGHGLKNDFKMINITVPADQIIDTVELFRLSHQRKISLRFLAAYLLKKDIQGVTHDSIEDANIALELYDVYCELKEAGTLKQKLQELYRWGRENKWDLEKLSTGS